MKNSKTLQEGLAFEDLKGLIASTVSIDQYKPKIGTEDQTVVLALTVTYEAPAKDLSSFIETSDVEHLDVDVSSAPEADGTYRVFVEFARDRNLHDKIEALLEQVDQITSKTENEWKYIAWQKGGKEESVTRENLERDIVDSPVRYRMDYMDDTPESDPVEESIERLKKLVNY